MQKQAASIEVGDEVIDKSGRVLLVTSVSTERGLVVVTLTADGLATGSAGLEPDAQVRVVEPELAPARRYEGRCLECDRRRCVCAPAIVLKETESGPVLAYADRCGHSACSQRYIDTGDSACRPDWEHVEKAGGAQ